MEAVDSKAGHCLCVGGQKWLWTWTPLKDLDPPAFQTENQVIKLPSLSSEFTQTLNWSTRQLMGHSGPRAGPLKLEITLVL